MLNFQVSATGLKLSELFQILGECREQFPIEDIAVSQMTLEHVFINMAKTQEVLQAGFIIQPVPVSGNVQGFTDVPPATEEGIVHNTGVMNVTAEPEEGIVYNTGLVSNDPVV